MRKATTIMFGEWLPDLAALGNPGTSDVENVRAEQGYYRSSSRLSAFTDALASPILGGIWARDHQPETQRFL